MKKWLWPADGSMKHPIPPQIVRLLALTVAIVVCYFTARHFLVPASFGQYGFFRGEALREIRALPVAYAGASACADCHADKMEKKSKGNHRGISCEACHGALNAHAENPAVKPPEIDGERFCLRCHRGDESRPEKFPQVDPAKHHAGKVCAECHQPHHPLPPPSK
jgi:hypothetical protein